MEAETIPPSGRDDRPAPAGADVDATADATANANAMSVHKRQASYNKTPPYWQRHRSVSSLTHRSLERGPAIRLEDNTEPDSTARQMVWAKSVAIDHYAVVQGNITGIGAYVVWNCIVQTLDGGPMTVRKRYSEFDDLRAQLVKAFPLASQKSLPPLPPKSAIYKFRAKFLEQRRIGLEYFLNCVLLNPGYASSPMVKEFVFSQTAS